jgi:hypothetical protein
MSWFIDVYNAIIELPLWAKIFLGIGIIFIILWTNIHTFSSKDERRGVGLEAEK